VLKSEAEAVLRSIAPVLAPLENQVTVEGHADPHGSPAPFATDWELSAARSTAVLRFLVESGGVQGTQISSVSYGSTRPTKLDFRQSEQANRRVDIVVHPTSSANVSALIPDVVAAGSAPATPEEHAGEEKSPHGTDSRTASTSGSAH
jgi:chemotaxis protein MotB